MKKIRKYLLAGSTLGILALVLSACSSSKSGQATKPGGIYGFFYQYIGLPLQHIMLQMAHALGSNGAGWAIIIMTFVVRLVLMPLMLYQQKKSIEQQEKTARLQPQMTLLQKAMKHENITQEQQFTLTGWQRDIYKKNNLSMTGGIGCLPLLIQFPILIGIYDAVYYSKALSAATFYGIPLSKRSIVLAIVATLLTVVQTWISTIGIPEQQKKTMQTMLWMNPLMTLFFSISFPSSIALYWAAGNLVLLVQQLVITFMLQPKVKANVEQELQNTPIVEVVTQEKIDQLFNQAAKSAKNTKNAQLHNDLRNRNKGKQHRK